MSLKEKETVIGFIRWFRLQSMYQYTINHDPNILAEAYLKHKRLKNNEANKI